MAITTTPYEVDPIEDLFTYHPPTEEQVAAYTEIRESAKRFARVVLEFVPAGPDRAHAIGSIREAVMLANASIATKNAMLRFFDREWYETHPRSEP